MKIKPIHQEMNIRGSDKFKSIFEDDKTNKKNRFEKVNIELSKLDREILEKQNKYKELMIEKRDLIKGFKEGDF